MTFFDKDEEMRGFDWQVTQRLASYLKPHRRNIGIAVAGMTLTVVANIVGTPLIGFAVDEGIRNRQMSVVGLGVLGYVVVQAFGMLGFNIQVTRMAATGQRIIQTLRDELFVHIQFLSISFFSKYETGRLIARVIGDVNVLREAITFAIVGSLREIMTLAGIVVAMLLINLPLTLVSLTTLVVLSLIANTWRIHARRSYLRVRETNARVNAELAESFNGVRVTQAFEREAYNYNRFRSKINRDNLDANLRATLVAALFFPGIELVGGVATGVLITIGGTLVLHQELTIFTLLTFVLYIDQFFFPIRMLAQRYNLLQAVMAAGAKLFTLLDTPYEITDAPNAIELPPIQGHIRLENVSFTYTGNGAGGDDTLKDIDLDIPAGCTVALVGHTGAGKSTLVKLVTRFYDVTAGRLTIDGYDVRQVAQRSLRSQMGVVLQETYLFSGSVMDNIRYGRPDAADEEVIEAARAVGAHDFILRLEKGYDTEVREGGSLLSAGQRQLLAFARALLADPRILILDEATSSIDTQTEKIIQAALKRLLKGRTSFVIAHRLSTITAADLIVVLDHGEIVEQGKHEELLTLGGAYHRLYTMA